MSSKKSVGQGQVMFAWAEDMFPICRSISGNGVRTTLQYIKNILPELEVHEVPTGTQAFDWTVPKEWNVTEAYIENMSGVRVVDFAENNLHLVGYSTPIDTVVSLEELQTHLHSLPEQPDLIPYITSYYCERWGFCISHKARLELVPGSYRVVIRGSLEPGAISLGELIIPGDTKEEVLLSTYVCHPSMANNELSGPVVLTALSRWLSSLKRRRYTYRVLFLVETIGSIVYISRHLHTLKERVLAGFVLTCVGDDNSYSFLPTRTGQTLADRVARHVLLHHSPDYVNYTFLDRGSDERQFCSPKVDLPIASMMRSKYGTFPEYHTSADNLQFISAEGLQGSYDLYINALSILELNAVYEVTQYCEPQMGKRGLYPTISTKGTAAQTRNMMNVLAYADGENDLIALADLIGLPCLEVSKIIGRLIDADLLRKVS